MFLSIIVACYNIEKYIKECVDSILAQTFTDFELILVDDGSTDNCGKICDEYQKNDSRIKVIHKANGGLVSARKAGLMQAQGKYACYVDGDDFILPQMYEKLCGHAKETGAEVVICDFFCVQETSGNDTTVQNVTNRFERGFYDRKTLEDKVYPFMLCDKIYFRPGFRAAVWAKIYQRELLLSEQMMVDDTIRMGEDTAVFFPALLQAKSMYYAKEEYLYGYRVREDSMSHDLRKPFHAEEVLVLIKHLGERFSLYPQYQEFLEKQRGLFGVFITEMLFSPHICLKGLFFAKDNLEEIKKYRNSNIGREIIEFAKNNPTSSRMKRVMAYMDTLSFTKKCNLYLFSLYEKMRKGS